jgi:hypothetical protein
MPGLDTPQGAAGDSPSIISVRRRAPVLLSLRAATGLHASVELWADVQPVARLAVDPDRAAALGVLLDRPAWLLLVAGEIAGGVLARLWALLPAADREVPVSDLADDRLVYAIPLRLVLVRPADRAHPADLQAEARRLFRELVPPAPGG